MEVRGDIKPVTESLIKPVCFMGAERGFGYANLLFFIMMMTFTFPSWYMLFFIFLFGFLTTAGKTIYKNDPYFFANYIKNSFFSAESRKYLFSTPNKSIKSAKSFRPRSIRKDNA